MLPSIEDYISMASILFLEGAHRVICTHTTHHTYTPHPLSYTTMVAYDILQFCSVIVILFQFYQVVDGIDDSILFYGVPWPSELLW